MAVTPKHTYAIRGGLRVTDTATLDVVRMVLIGKVNSELVCLICQLGGHAIGLSGIDGLLLRSGQLTPQFGYVGSVTAVDPRPIATMSATGYIPVIALFGLSDTGDSPTSTPTMRPLKLLEASRLPICLT